MAKPNIQNIATTQTFQNWFDKTNEMVNIFRDSAITAQAGSADTTDGDAILNGEFTANELIGVVKVSTDTIESRTPATAVSFASPVIVTPVSDAIAITFAYASGGGKARFTDNQTNWDIGYASGSDSSFEMNNGGGGQFSLSTAGVLTVPSLVTSADVQIGTNLTVPGILTAITLLFKQEQQVILVVHLLVTLQAIFTTHKEIKFLKTVDQLPTYQQHLLVT